MYIMFHKGRLVGESESCNLNDLEKMHDKTYIYNNRSQLWYRVHRTKRQTKDKAVHLSHVPKSIRAMALLLT